MGKIIRNVFLGMGILFLPFLSYSQFSIGGGVSSFMGLNVPTKRFGFNVFGEFPRSHTNTFMIRAVYMLPVKNTINQATVSAKAPNISPPQANATKFQKTSYFAIDGGTRYYFINDYDIGFSVFAGGYLKGILSSMSATYRLDGGLNPDDYVGMNGQPLSSADKRYSVFFAFGGTVGVKYNLPTKGAIVFDLGLELVSRIIDPNMILGNEISPLSLSLNLAYRFDWY